MPIILRLLYGRTIVHGKNDQSVRKSIFLLLSRLAEDETKYFFNLALGPLTELKLVNDGRFREERLTLELLSPRKQHGMLNMLKEILDILQTTAVPFAHLLVDPIVYSLLRALRSEKSANQGEVLSSSFAKVDKTTGSTLPHCAI